MSRPQDLFPTRLERKLGMFERLDPVVHTPEERLSDGPLSTDQVREFDERGFLFFDSFFSKDERQRGLHSPIADKLQTRLQGQGFQLAFRFRNLAQ